MPGKKPSAETATGSEQQSSTASTATEILIMGPYSFENAPNKGAPKGAVLVSKSHAFSGSISRYYATIFVLSISFL
jgi:hypothetical protein